MSMVLRNIHQTITEEYGQPAYVSYILFAVFTILLGGVLGLIMVCCVDCLCPISGGATKRYSAEQVISALSLLSHPSAY